MVGALGVAADMHTYSTAAGCPRQFLTLYVLLLSGTCTCMLEELSQDSALNACMYCKHIYARTHERCNRHLALMSWIPSILGEEAVPDFLQIAMNIVSRCVCSLLSRILPLQCRDSSVCEAPLETSMQLCCANSKQVSRLWKITLLVCLLFCLRNPG